MRNVASIQQPAVLRAAPGNPDASYIVQKLEGTAAQGARMPFGGPYLPQDRIDLVRRWIAAGAPPVAVAPSSRQSCPGSENERSYAIASPGSRRLRASSPQMRKP